jgi:hypothetical protein
VVVSFIGGGKLPIQRLGMTLLMIIKSDIEIVTYSLKLRYFFIQLSLGLYPVSFILQRAAYI